MTLANISRNMIMRFSFCSLGMLMTLAVLVDAHAAAEAPEVQQHFASPQQAVEALFTAVKNDDTAGILTILGPDAQDLVSSGDMIADHNGRKRFQQAYNEQHRVEQEDEANAVLIVGAKEYPFPIPIVLQGDYWIFDTQAGMEEILNRRIGRNELHTIEVLQAYTAAQREYACIPRNDGGTEFAQKFASTEGTKDGLYWPAGPGEEESPFGPLIARATEEGYAGGLDADPPEPFHGYYFKILKAQGENATGGAFDYVVDGKMVLGFALVAYPARYGVSGIMTFIVNQEGIIYENDLGEDTNRAAPAMLSFDPDDSWQKYEEPAGE